MRDLNRLDGPADTGVIPADVRIISPSHWVAMCFVTRINFLALSRMAIGVFVGLLALSSSANVTEVYLNFNELNDKYPAPRWEYGFAKVSPSELSLKNLRVHWSDRKFKKCTHQSKLALAKIPSLAPWVNVYRLLCAEGLARVKGEYEPLKWVLSEISQKPSWLIVGPYRNRLRQAFVSGLMTQLFTKFCRGVYRLGKPLIS